MRMRAREAALFHSAFDRQLIGIYSAKHCNSHCKLGLQFKALFYTKYKITCVMTCDWPSFALQLPVLCTVIGLQLPVQIRPVFYTKYKITRDWPAFAQHR